MFLHDFSWCLSPYSTHVHVFPYVCCECSVFWLCIHGSLWVGVLAFVLHLFWPCFPVLFAAGKWFILHLTWNLLFNTHWYVCEWLFHVLVHVMWMFFDHVLGVCVALVLTVVVVFSLLFHSFFTLKKVCCYCFQQQISSHIHVDVIFACLFWQHCLICFCLGGMHTYGMCVVLCNVTIPVFRLFQIIVVNISQWFDCQWLQIDICISWKCFDNHFMRIDHFHIFLHSFVTCVWFAAGWSNHWRHRWRHR